MMRHVTYNVYVARVLQVGLLEVTVPFKFCLGHGAMDTIKREKKKAWVLMYSCWRCADVKVLTVSSKDPVKPRSRSNGS